MTGKLKIVISSDHVGIDLRKTVAAHLAALGPAVEDVGPVTAERLFGHDRPLHFEIGFGGGEHMAARADMLPDHVDGYQHSDLSISILRRISRDGNRISGPGLGKNANFIVPLRRTTG